MGLQDRTTDLNLGKPRKNLVSGNVKCLRLEAKDNKIKVSQLMLANVFLIIIF